MANVAASDPRHGLGLVERVIASAPWSTLAQHKIPEKPQLPSSPRRSSLAPLRLASGAALPPSLTRWLQQDLGFLGWTDSEGAPVLRPRSLGLLTAWNYQRDWGFLSLETTLPRSCYWLPIGDESMRFLYDGTPDAFGEQPILLADVDDQPFVTLGYPGFDVYIAVAAGLLKESSDWTADPVYGARARFHVQTTLGGKPTLDLPSLDGWRFDEFPHPLTGEPSGRFVSPTGATAHWEREPARIESGPNVFGGPPLRIPTPIRP